MASLFIFRNVFKKFLLHWLLKHVYSAPKQDSPSLICSDRGQRLRSFSCNWEMEGSRDLESSMRSGFLVVLSGLAGITGFIFSSTVGAWCSSECGVNCLSLQVTWSIYNLSSLCKRGCGPNHQRITKVSSVRVFRNVKPMPTFSWAHWNQESFLKQTPPPHIGKDI